MRKKSLIPLCALTLCAGLLAGCGSNHSSSSGNGSTLNGIVSTNGSTSMERVIGALNETFMNDNPRVTVTYDPTGSGTGITAVADGRTDIGLASRDLTADEKASLTQTVLAKDGIAVIVNPQNGVSDLSLDQLSQLFTGRITNWSQVGGADAQVVLIGREAGSGTRDGFESATGTKDACQYKQELNSTGGVAEAVKSNPNSIGYTSLAAVDDSVKTLTVNGVAPTADTVKDGSYKVQRDFILVTRTGQPLSGIAQAYFDFITSSAAADVITAAGAVPVA